MSNFTVTVNLRCKVSGRDDVNPNKQTSQRFEKYDVSTQVIDDYEWATRKVIAYMILKYGTEIEDWREYP
jgi:hypothetical protein